MEFNELYVADNKKTPEWIEKVVKHYVQAEQGNGADVSRDEICWQYYHNELNDSRFDYLLEVGNYSLPAKPRHIPLQKHLLDSLSSQQVRRPFVFSISSIDEKSVKKKSQKRVRAAMNDIEMLIRQKHYGNITNIHKLQSQITQLKQALQREPQNEQEFEAMRQMEMQLPYMEIEINHLIEVIKAEDSIDEKQIEQLQRYYRYSHKDLEEEIAQKLMIKLRRDLNIKGKSGNNFISHIVTGKQYYYVDYIAGEKWPRMDNISSTKLRYPKVPNIPWVQDGPWCIIEELMSYQQVYREFGTDIIAKYGDNKLKELSEVAQYKTTNSTRFISTPYGGVDYNGPYQGSFENSSGISVKRCYVKIPRKIRMKLSPNKYDPNKFFRHFSSDEKPLINEDHYNYSKGVYTSKKDKDVQYNRKDVDSYRDSRGESVTEYPINDVYQGVVINNEITIQCRKKEEAPRDIDSYGDVKLPVIGPTFSDISRQPYSLIWTTKDLQELYDIVYTMRELMLAVSGTKTIIFDQSQKNSTLEDDEFEYQKKKGTIPIETVDSVTGRAKNASFNQWQMIDLSLSQSVQYLENMLQQLEEAMGNIIGIPRQRQGQVVNTDQVGTYKESIQRAQLITEILYHDHDQIEAKALTQLLNLAGKYCMHKESVLEIQDNDFGRDFVNLPKNLFKDMQFECIVQDNSEEQRKVEELRNLSMMAFKSNQLPFSAIIETYDSETLVAMKNKVKYFVDQAEELQQANAEAERDSRAQAEQQRTQLQQELAKFAAESQMNLEKLKGQVAIEKENIKAKSESMDRELDARKMEIDSKLKYFELLNEQQSENAVLANNDKHSTISEKISVLELQMNNILGMANLLSNDEIGREKVKVEKEKAKKIVKEHVSDK